MTPSNHSPEAIAAYPGSEEDPLCRIQRTAFDAGVAATKAQQYAAKRDELVRFISDWHYGELNAGEGEPTKNDYDLADALLAPDGPLLDAGEVWEQGHAAGHDDYVGNDGTWPTTPNPYREAKP